MSTANPTAAKDWRFDPEVETVLTQFRNGANSTDLDFAVEILRLKGAECNDRNVAAFKADMNALCLELKVEFEARRQLVQGFCN